MVLDMPVIRRSTMVIAAMDSTTTTALGTMTGSCLPVIEMVVSSPFRVTVC